MTFDEIVAGNGEIKKLGDTGYTMKDFARAITCCDETTISVQGSRTHYCTPRTDAGPYSHVECGFPSVSPLDSWREFFDGDWADGDHCESVYGYVPIALVREFIEIHGGEVT